MTEEDFKLLIEQNLRIWQCTVLRITYNAEDADEAVQQALIAAWNKRHSFGFRAKPSSWICRIAINKACNIIRKRQRDTQRHLDYADRQSHDNNLLDKLREAIILLPEPSREIIVTAIAHDLNADKCAVLLNCSSGIFYRKLKKAKKQLKKIMEEL